MTGHPFESFAPGQRYLTGARTLSEAEIVAFARDWDPQSFHLDAAAAKSSIFGGVVASGLQTLAVAFLLFFEARVFGDWFEAGLGADELRWRVPVRPGDMLTTEVEILEARASRSRPASGLVTSRFAVKNQRGETVLSLVSVDMVKRRTALA